MKKWISIFVAALLLVSWMFPYKVAYSNSGHRMWDVGFKFLFAYSQRAERVDFSRLILADLCIVGLALFGMRFYHAKQDVELNKLRRLNESLNRENDELLSMLEKLKVAADGGAPGKN